jgi:hypothetical protein
MAILASIQSTTFCFLSTVEKKHKNEVIKHHHFASVLHGCKTFFLVLGEDNGLRVFENWVLRKISGTKRDGRVEISARRGPV